MIPRMTAKMKMMTAKIHMNLTGFFKIYFLKRRNKRPKKTMRQARTRIAMANPCIMF
jgi:hypothetical protein